MINGNGLYGVRVDKAFWSWWRVMEPVIANLILMTE